MALRMVVVSWAVWAVWSPIQSPARPAVPRATAEISGTVVTDESSPVPLRRARVTVASADGRGGMTVVSDDSGRFVVGSLPAGRYTV